MLLFFITLLSAQAAEPVRVFLFAGQSNMEGADTDPKLVETSPHFKYDLEALDNVHYSYQTGAKHKSNG
ncbi:sialate O-acetylesterase [Akkermansiaceae bacterium]|nr:sialate O-acetylesterase [Akkermansiaceae bacterium]